MFLTRLRNLINALAVLNSRVQTAQFYEKNFNKLCMTCCYMLQNTTLEMQTNVVSELLG